MCAGIGVHSGAHARMALLPAPAGSGIVFIRGDMKSGDNRIPARADCVSSTAMSTTLANAAGASVDTVEHLMAAMAGLEIDNIVIELDGPEVPIMDGSSAPFVELLANVGTKAQNAARQRLEILDRVCVSDGDRIAMLEPWEDTVFDLAIHYADAVIGEQHFVYRPSRTAFLRDIAEARTYGFMRDVARLRAAGKANGASHDNTIVIDEGRVINAHGLRFEDEFVRHKVLDAIGDMALLGAPFIGRYSARQPGHALNAQLTAKLLATPSAWRLVEDANLAASPLAAIARG